MSQKIYCATLYLPHILLHSYYYFYSFKFILIYLIPPSFKIHNLLIIFSVINSWFTIFTKAEKNKPTHITILNPKISHALLSLFIFNFYPTSCPSSFLIYSKSVVNYYNKKSNLSCLFC